MVGASPRALGLVKDFSCDCTFWDERGGGLAPVGPRVDTATIRTAQIAWTREVLARDAVRFDVHTRAQTLFGYFVSD